jgi:hypothetical protein
MGVGFHGAVTVVTGTVRQGVSSGKRRAYQSTPPHRDTNNTNHDTSDTKWCVGRHSRAVLGSVSYRSIR